MDKIALWIDVEGAGYEVLEGMSGIQKNVSLIHIEVETKTFWKGQRLKPEVESLLDSMGFRFLGRGMPEEQHDLVYINKKIFDRSPLRFRWITFVSFVFTYLQTIMDLFKIKK
ncbi:MAG: FkbM family methyltransferase [Candidatus Omnitrophica bacterium]|nr:FkbM family methyltransferase [Candidatus Omnitrophota bacterium]